LQLKLQLVNCLQKRPKFKLNEMQVRTKLSCVFLTVFMDFNVVRTADSLDDVGESALTQWRANAYRQSKSIRKTPHTYRTHVLTTHFLLAAATRSGCSTSVS
jgi:hypothetical protein